MRAALETEILYAADFPFCDYGSDLNLMAEMEKGVKLKRLATKDHDTGVPEQEQKEVDAYLSRLPRRRYDKIPVKFYGKGPNGYLLYDMTFHKSNKAA